MDILLDNLRNLSLLAWLLGGVVFVAATLLLWWLHHDFELTEIELPFKIKFKRREKKTEYQISPSPLLSQPTPPAPPAPLQTDPDISAPPKSPALSDSHGPAPAPRVSRYIDRGKIETQVRERLAARNSAAIVGVHAPGGEGKTELAIRADDDLRSRFDEVWWVDVGEKTREQIVADIAAQCGVRFDPKWDYHQQTQAVRAALAQHRWLAQSWAKPTCE